MLTKLWISDLPRQLLQRFETEIKTQHVGAGGKYEHLHGYFYLILLNELVTNRKSSGQRTYFLLPGGGGVWGGFVPLPPRDGRTGRRPPRNNDRHSDVLLMLYVRFLPHDILLLVLATELKGSLHMLIFPYLDLYGWLVYG